MNAGAHEALERPGAMRLVDAFRIRAAGHRDKCPCSRDTYPDTRLPAAKRTCVIEKLLIRQGAAKFGSKRRDIFGGDVLTQRQIAEACGVSPYTVNKLAFYIEDCDRAGLDPYGFAASGSTLDVHGKRRNR